MWGKIVSSNQLRLVRSECEVPSSTASDPARELEELKALEERYGQMLEETAKVR